MIWIQHEIRLPAFSEGCHPITRHIVEGVPELADVRIGMMHVFLQHTSASLTINENADPDVVHDVLEALQQIVPWRQGFYRHCEGNSAAHVKSSMMGCSTTVPISGGRMALGTWQAIFFCEFDGPRTRHALVTVMGS